MRTAAKVLRFPLAGISHEIAYREATIPTDQGLFATPYAVNVRGRDTFGERIRGGSRAGLRPCEKPDNLRLLHAVDDASLGTDIQAVYRNRLWYAKDANWYCSAIGKNFTLDESGTITAAEWDFDFGKDADDPSRAAAGNLGLAGKDGETITAIMPVNDDFVYLATENTLFGMAGDPLSAPMKPVSNVTGAMSEKAWCTDGHTVWFLGHRGLYAVQPGQPAMLVSQQIPDELQDASGAILAYDKIGECVHIFLDSEDNDWLYEPDRKAFWQMDYGTLIPTEIGEASGRLYFHCGYGWYWFDDEYSADGVSTPITSRVLIGPIRVSQRDDMDGFLQRYQAAIAANSNAVTIKTFTGHTPEEAVSHAVEEDPFVSTTLTGGWNRTFRPRQRGAWVCFSLESSGRWAYESITAVMAMTGELR